MSRLHEAAEAGEHDEVIALLRVCEDIEARDQFHFTALHAAAWSGRGAIASTLLDHGANIEAIEREGWTPLHAAVWNGHAGVVMTLLGRGANIEARDRGGSTPMELALNKKQHQVLYVLRVLGASLDGIEIDGVVQVISKKSRLECAIETGFPRLVLQVLNESAADQVGPKRLADAMQKAAAQDEILNVIRSWTTRRSASEAMNACGVRTGREP